ncbi:MAG: RNA polymerase sigma factor region1.1 domain-containing protein, partial [Myxococcota bacterium]|nr:RNA polymerase sigma factor region1.1 domain-containing protein [Myxococcota bacterium]
MDGVEIRDETRDLRPVKRLLSRGRRRGYLTVDDVNQALPDEVLSTDQIDEVMALFGEHDIAVVDSPREARRLREPMLDGAEEEVGHSNDPVRVYLREMGQVSLLTREGEVEIAQRIENAEHAILHATVGTPVGIREVLALGDRLRKGKLEPRDVLDGLDAEGEDVPTPEARRKTLLAALARVRRLETEAARRHAAAANPRTSAEKRATILAEIDQRYREMVDLLIAERFAKARFSEIVDMVRQRGERMA